VSISFCLPVKNGWQALQISRWSSCLVERVWNLFPHAQRPRPRDTSDESQASKRAPRAFANLSIQPMGCRTSGPTRWRRSRWTKSAPGHSVRGPRFWSTCRGRRIPGMMVDTSGFARMNRKARSGQRHARRQISRRRSTRSRISESFAGVKYRFRQSPSGQSYRGHRAVRLPSQSEGTSRHQRNASTAKSSVFFGYPQANSTLFYLLSDQPPGYIEPTSFSR